MSMSRRHHMALIVIVCATLLSSRPALAQFSQQGPKLLRRGLRRWPPADCRDPNIEQLPVRHRLFGWLSWLARSSGNACVYAVKE